MYKTLGLQQYYYFKEKRKTNTFFIESINKKQTKDSVFSSLVAAVMPLVNSLSVQGQGALRFLSHSFSKTSSSCSDYLKNPDERSF